jgi:hypothetical protein
VCLWCLCVYECVIFKLIGRFYVYLFKSQSEAVKMKTWEAFIVYNFFSFLSKYGLKFAKLSLSAIRAKKVEKHLLNLIFSFKILNHKSRFVVVYICLKLMYNRNYKFWSFFFVSSKKEGIQRGTLVIHVMKCFGFLFFLHFSGRPLIHGGSTYTGVFLNEFCFEFL